jgi:hypothetical protein
MMVQWLLAGLHVKSKEEHTKHKFEIKASQRGNSTLLGVLLLFLFACLVPLQRCFMCSLDHLWQGQVNFVCCCWLR